MVLDYKAVDAIPDKIQYTPRYDYIWRCEGLYLATLQNTECIAFDAETLEERFRASGEGVFAYDDGSRVVVCDDASTRLYDQEGNLLWTASADATLSGTEKGLILASDGPWGSPRSALYSADGQRLCEPCQLLYSLGVVDGTEYFAYRVMDSEEAEDDWIYAPSTARYGILNEEGRAVTEAVFSDLYSLEEEAPFFYAATEAQEGLVAPDGEWITVLTWKEAEG